MMNKKQLELIANCDDFEKVVAIRKPNTNTKITRQIWCITTAKKLKSK